MQVAYTKKFSGYIRPDGKVGVRNHVAVISTVMCTGPIPQRIADQVDGVVPITHPWCFAVKETLPILTGTAENPNIGAVLLVTLGCEEVNAEDIADKIAKSKKLCRILNVRETGGTPRTIEEGIRIAQKMVQELSYKSKREHVDVAALNVGVKCAGSDATSGLAANPSAGVTMDKLIDEGGGVIIAEPIEMVGAEEILAKRAINKKVEQKIKKIIRESLENYPGRESMVGVIKKKLISPGNIKGGLTTLTEKALGAVLKGGTSPIQGVLDYAKPLPGKGLYIMNETGMHMTDVAICTAFFASGAQIVVMTTGVGTAVGSPIGPIIKVTGNPETFRKMEDNMDINAGAIFEENKTIPEVGEEIFEEIIRVASGKKTKAEILKYYEFAANRSF